MCAVENMLFAARAVEPRFLVVDDEPNMVGTLALILDHLGYTVETAESGTEALAKLSERGFDCVLSDVDMPGMSGVDLCRAIQARWPKTRILLMTAYAEDSLVQRAWEHGAAAVLQKPLDVDRLLAFLSALGCGRKVEGELR
jgi:CheY-like chemotaxis protein